MAVHTVNQPWADPRSSEDVRMLAAEEPCISEWELAFPERNMIMSADFARSLVNRSVAAGVYF